MSTNDNKKRSDHDSSQEERRDDQLKSSEAGNPEVKRENENVAAAFQEASKDIDEDPDFSMRSPNDDLDEGETARLGEDKTDLV